MSINKFTWRVYGFRLSQLFICLTSVSTLVPHDLKKSFFKRRDDSLFISLTANDDDGDAAADS